MRVLVTGSSGHLGEALMRALPLQGMSPVGLDCKPGPYTSHLGSVADRKVARAALDGADAVLHTATLHKPHVATHTRQDFVDTNITGTLTLLEACRDMAVGRFIFTSTTSAFGAALSPPSGAPAAWIDESVPSVPRNIYGVTKTAAEDLCELFSRRFGLSVIVLRTSRFFPEADDSPDIRATFADENAKANEFLFRRLDIEDAVSGHLAALERAETLGWGRFVLSATTPFQPGDCAALATDPKRVVSRRVPGFAETYRRRGYRMFRSIDRVYDNSAARQHLKWSPRWSFEAILQELDAHRPIGSDLARAVGVKGYHERVFENGPYPVAP